MKYRFLQLSWYLVASILVLVPMMPGLTATAVSSGAVVQENRHFDARRTFNQGFKRMPGAAQRRAMEAMGREVADLAADYDPTTGVLRTLSSHTGYLTSPKRGQEAGSIAMGFVQNHLNMMGLTAEDLAGYEIVDEVYSKVTGATHLHMGQVYKNLPVYNSRLQVNINRDGQILSVNNGFMPGMAGAANTTTPQIGLAVAVRKAAQHLGIVLYRPPRELGKAEGVQRRTAVDPRGVSLVPIEGKLMWLPIRYGMMRLVWNFQIQTPDNAHVYDFTVDAVSGKIWTRFDWVASDQYRVYPIPSESPNHATPLPPGDGRDQVNDVADPAASPFGWHDTNGAVGAEFTTTRGNNVHAYTDINADDLPDAGSSPNGGNALRFDFPIDLRQPPSAYRPGVVTNLFYWNNLIHDVQYQYGFDEVAGNFQTNNYGRGGSGNDAVRAEAQDGEDMNNANFLSPPDGSAPRMQMFLWNAVNPNRDGDLDNGIIIHEYGHGISTRLVGGPSNPNCLTNNQQPGEGLSDWWSLVYTAEPGDAGPDPRGIGTYVLGQPRNGLGIRTQRYSTDPAVNNWTYASVRGMAIPHGVGSVWAQVAWEVYWALVDHHGFDPDLYDAQGNAGNQRMMLYVNEGLKNTPCNPSFTEVRGGIIQAAMDNHGGEDVCRMWQAFASFGLGTDAISGGPNSTSPSNGFLPPASCTAPPAAPSCPADAINFTQFPLEAYSNQDGSGTDNVEAGGDVLFLEGNRWLRSVQAFTVTADTIVEFFFQSTAQGEIHAIGFDEDQTLNNDPRHFQFWGTQNWTGTANIGFTPRYAAAGDFQRFSIPVGKEYSGSDMHLVFINDKDAGSLDNQGRFACVRVLGDQPSPPAGLFEAHFDTGTEGFVYQDDAFRGTNQPVYASGSFQPNRGFSGGGLSVVLGGIDGVDILGMSGGWRRTFTLASATPVTLSIRYNLTQSPDYESDEFSDALLAVDGRLVRVGSNDRLARISGDGNGGGVQSTGWVQRVFDLGTLSAGTHTVTLGGYNNKKTFNNESTEVLIDDVVAVVTQSGGCTVDDDFEAGAAGWVNSAISTCATGDFVLDNPTVVVNGGVTTQVGGDHTSGAGNALFTATNSSAGINDVDRGVCVLESPNFDVLDPSTLSIWYFHGQRDAGNDPGADFFRLDVSTDGGTRYTPLVSIGDVTTNAVWTNATASIPGGSQVRIRVQASDGAGQGDLIEAGIDDLSICRAGFN